jgi:hypothetical protein
MKALFTLIAAVAAFTALAGSAHAATVNVRIGNEATPGRLMTATASGAVLMLPQVASGRSQVWVKSGTNPGFSTYRSALTAECLTVRGLPAMPVVRLQPCIPGSTSQLWRTDADGSIFSRAAGLALETAGYAVQLGEVTGKPNQRWVHKLA